MSGAAVDPHAGRGGVKRLLSRLPWTGPALFALANQVVASGSNFATGVIIGRACSKEEFGLYMLGFSVLLFMTDLQLSLVSTPYQVQRPRLAGERLRLYNGSSLLLNLSLSLLLAAALAVAALALSRGGGAPGLSRVLFALSLAAVAVMSREFVRRFCFAALSPERALAFDLWVALIQVGGMLALSGCGLLASHTAYWATGLACGAVSAAWLLKGRGEFAFGARDALADLRLNWSFGKWILASGLIWTLGMNLYPWALASFHGPAAAGVWGACSGVLALMNVPLLGVLNQMGPSLAASFARGGVGELRPAVFRGAAAVCALMALLAGAIFLAGDPLLVLLYGAKYAGNRELVLLLALNLLVSGVSFPFSRGLFVLERGDAEFRTNLVPLLVLFGCGLSLARTHGATGGAAGLLLANTASLAVRALCFLGASGSFPAAHSLPGSGEA